jgi:two-component system response regulator AtoC
LRLLSATHKNLKKQVEAGSFRADIMFRINAATIELLPLRKRLRDLPQLMEYFLDSYQRIFRQRVPSISSRVVRIMQKYHWPGNIRELENLIRMYVAIGDEERIASELLMNEPSDRGDEWGIENIEIGPLKEITRSIVRRVERHVILKALKANDWNRKKTAKVLKMSYRSLLYKLDRVDDPRTDISQAHEGPVAPKTADPESPTLSAASSLD